MPADWILKPADLIALAMNKCFGTLDPESTAYADCRPVMDVIVANAHDLDALSASVQLGVIPEGLAAYSMQPQPKMRRMNVRQPPRVFPTEGNLVAELIRLLVFLSDWKAAHPGFEGDV